MNFTDFLLEAYREKTFKLYPAKDKHSDTVTDKHKYFSDILSHELSPVHEQFIRGYTNIGYHETNKTLWDSTQHESIIGVVPPEDITHHNNPIEKIIQVHNALKSFPPAKESFYVYSGTRYPQQLKHTIEHGNGYVNSCIPSFFSTTLDPSVAHKFSSPDLSDMNAERHILRIKVNEGQQVGGYIQPYSEHPKEEEFLMNANHLLHIKKSTQMQDSRGNNVIMHDAEILSPNQIKRIPNGTNSEVDSYHIHSKKLDDLLKTDVSNFPVTSTINEYGNTNNQNKLVDLFDKNSPNHNTTLSSLARITALKNKNLTDDSISRIIKHGTAYHGTLAFHLKNRATKQHISELIDNYIRTKQLHLDDMRVIGKMKNYSPEHLDQYYKIKKRSR